MRETGLMRFGAILCLGSLMLVAGNGFLQAQVVPGLEVLLTEQRSLVEGQRVGLITNHTAVDRQARHAIDLLARTPGVKLSALFAPEHGIRGMVQAGGEVAHTTDPKTGVPGPDVLLRLGLEEENAS